MPRLRKDMTMQDPRHGFMTPEVRLAQRRLMVEMIYGEGHWMVESMPYDCREMTDHNFMNLCQHLMRHELIGKGETPDKAGMMSVAAYTELCMGGFLERILRERRK